MYVPIVRSMFPCSHLSYIFRSFYVHPCVRPSLSPSYLTSPFINLYLALYVSLCFSVCLSNRPSVHLPFKHGRERFKLTVFCNSYLSDGVINTIDLYSLPKLNNMSKITRFNWYETSLRYTLLSQHQGYIVGKTFVYHEGYNSPCLLIDLAAAIIGETFQHHLQILIQISVEKVEI